MKVVGVIAAVIISLTILLTACTRAESNSNKDLHTIPIAEIVISEEEREAQHLNEVLEVYQQYIETAMDTLNLPSVAYAIVKDGKVIHQYTAGVKEVGTLDAIDENTVYRIASISKSFAAVLAGVLVEKKAFDWEDKIKTLEPRFRLKTRSQTDSMTVRHILSHTTGLRKYALSRTIQAGKPYSEVFAELRKAPIENKPGEVYSYQNAIYSAISNVVKKKTKYSYERMLDSLIFKPLQMPNISTGYNSMMKNENRAMPHIPTDKIYWKSGDIRTKWYNVAPAAGVNASLADMTIWLNAMLGHYPDVISPQALEQVFEVNIPMDEDSDYYETWAPGLTQASYAMGWRVFDFRNNKIMYHGGWVRGYRPEMAFCPKEDIGIVFLTNSNKNDLSTNCIPTFFKLYFQAKEEHLKKREPIKIPTIPTPQSIETAR